MDLRPTGEPPQQERLKRWWVFLAQFELKILHIPGIKNELADFISRNNFQEKYEVDLEREAQSAFSRMDMQLDLRLEEIGMVESWSLDDYDG